MSVRAARMLVVGWGVGYVICLSWPVIGAFNRIEPKILGMPFIMVFVTGWLVLGLIVLYVLDRAVTQEEAAGSSPGDGPPS